MSDFVACVKEQVRKRNLKELVKARTGLSLTPPVFIAVLAFAAAGTALTLLAVSSLLVPPKKNDKLHEVPIDDDIMRHTPSNQREVDVIPVSLESPIIEEEKGEEEDKDEDGVKTPKEEGEPPANDVEAPVRKEVEAPAPSTEETVETTTPKAADGEDNLRSVRTLENAPKDNNTLNGGVFGYLKDYITFEDKVKQGVAFVASVGAIAAVGVVPAVVVATVAAVSVIMSPTQNNDADTEVVTAEEETQKE